MRLLLLLVRLPGAGMGVVSKVGAGVTEFHVGQRVTSLGWMADQGQGSWQGSVTLPADRLVALPDGISDEAGAQFYVSIIVCRQDMLPLMCTSDQHVQAMCNACYFLYALELYGKSVVWGCVAAC